MAVFRVSTALAIGAVNANIMAGSPFEFPGLNGVQIAMCADDADILADISFGGRIVAQQLAVPVEPGALQGPNINEQMIVDEAIAPGERITIRLTGGAGASVTRTLVNLTPL